MSEKKRSAAVFVAAAVVALVPVAASSASAGAAAYRPTRVEDPVGDVRAAPDVSMVDVGTDAVAGSIVIWVKTPNRTRLTGDDVLSILVDTDLNAATGMPPYGFDYVLGYTGSPFLMQLGPDGPTEAAAPSLAAHQYDEELRISIQPSDLGGTKAFNFWVVSASGQEMDRAPDAGPAAYTLQSGPLVLMAAEVGLSPKVARAGKRVTAVLLPAREDTWEYLWEGAVRCTAKVGARPVSVRKGWGDSGAYCALTVPRSAKGKRLTIALSVTFGGQTVSRTYRTVVH